MQNSGCGNGLRINMVHADCRPRYDCFYSEKGHPEKDREAKQPKFWLKRSYGRLLEAIVNKPRKFHTPGFGLEVTVSTVDVNGQQVFCAPNPDVCRSWLISHGFRPSRYSTDLLEAVEKLSLEGANNGKIA